MIGAKVTKVFVGAAAVLLIGYAFFGRSFAYLGVAPLYLGELVLPLALLALLRGRRYGTLQPIHLMLLAFMTLGALRTIPYLGVHGIDALRDAVTWGYAAYAIVVAFVLTEDHLNAGIGIYRRLIPSS